MDNPSKRMANLSPQEKRTLLAQLLQKKASQNQSSSEQQDILHQSTQESFADHAASVVLPAIVSAPDQRYQPFPLTDIQQAYWMGRGGTFELGNVGTHIYLELDCHGLNLERLKIPPLSPSPNSIVAVPKSIRTVGNN